MLPVTVVDEKNRRRCCSCHSPHTPLTGLGSSQNTQPRRHLFIYFPPHRSTGEAYPGMCLGSGWCRAQPSSLGTQESVPRLHGSPCPLVGFYHRVLEDTAVLLYLPHTPPSSPVKTPAKVSFVHFLANPCHNWPDWFENAWCKLVPGLPLCGNEPLPGPAWPCTVRCPSIPTSTQLAQPGFSYCDPAAARGGAG